MAELGIEAHKPILKGLFSVFMMSNPFKILFPLLELLYHFYWTIIDYDVIKVGKNRAFGLERRPFMIKFVGWLVRDPEILSLDVKAFLFMDDTIRNERNILHQLQSVIASERRKKSCREQFTMSAERQAQYIPQLLPICTHSIFDNRAQKSSSKSKWKITLQSDCRIMSLLVTTVKPIVLKVESFWIEVIKKCNLSCISKLCSSPMVLTLTVMHN